MTTIAWDGETLASDSRQTGDNSFIHQVKSKKICKIGNSYLGFAGEAQQEELFKRWFKNQTNEKPEPSWLKDLEVMLIRDGVCYEINDLCEPTPVGKPYAIGSGEQYAMGAMKHGATAKEAVDIAKILDPFTGGTTVTVKTK